MHGSKDNLESVLFHHVASWVLKTLFFKGNLPTKHQYSINFPMACMIFIQTLTPTSSFILIL